MALVIARTAGVIDQHRVAFRRGRRDDGFADLREVGYVEVRYGEGQYPEAGLAQVARCEVGPIVQLLDGRADPLARLRRDERQIADNVRDRLD